MPLVVNQVEIPWGASIASRTTPSIGAYRTASLPCPGARWPAADWVTAAVWIPRTHAQRAGALLDLLDVKARECGVSRTVLSLAWLLKYPSRIIPIVGSVTPARIQDAVKADGLTLSREDWYSILVAARMRGLP
jgi:aryl-alcohol dehydrogenase-like predicted oxidoreductase